MMTEISLNVLDVAENSTRAGAKLVTITVAADMNADKMGIRDRGDGGRWPEIYALNKSRIANPNIIYVDQLLELPAS